MLEYEHVTKVFRGPDGAAVTAVDDLSLTVGEGEVCCLIGTSGCGKTTTMKMANRLIEPTGGRITVDGADVGHADPIELRRRIGYVMQHGGLFPHWTVARNVGLPCELAGWAPAATRDRVRELLGLVNLPPDAFADRHPRALSGGERQRVGVARALALDPTLILMDEPFGALDPMTRAQLQDEFRQLATRVAKTVLLVTHDMREAARLGDRIALMDQGRLVQVGSYDELRARPATPFVAAFLAGHAAGAPADD